jgi:hypothetical protein
MPVHSHNTRAARAPVATSQSANHVDELVATAPSPTSLPGQGHDYWQANAVIDSLTGAELNYRQVQAGTYGAGWEQGCANEFGHLAQGYGDKIAGTDTLFFIRHTDLPEGRTATYSRFVVSEKPDKKEPKRVRITVDGNRIDYPGNVSTPTSDLTTVKILANSVCSTPGAKFATIDIKDFYLNTPMERYEYMRIPVKDIPAVIMEQYNLLPLVHNGFVLVEIRKGLYGLPQAGLLANERLVKHLSTYGYYPAKHTPGLFRHKSRDIRSPS